MKSNFGKIRATIGVIVLATSTLSAATFVVSTTQDSGGGSLRQAILNANNSGGNIVFSNVTGVISLSSPLPLITANVNILGPGTNLLTVSGNNKYSIFAINAGSTNTFSNFTIANGYAASEFAESSHGFGTVNFPGCAISNSGSMTVLSCTISNCVNLGWGTDDEVGGAVYNTGNLAMQNCLFIASGSSEDDSGVAGGCIFNTSYLSMNNCILTNCRASDAAGILNEGTALLNNCLLTDLEEDYSEGTSGAIESTGGLLTLVSCTISNCEAGWNGGAIWGDNVIMTNTLIVGNGAGFEGGGLFLTGNNYLYGCTISGNAGGEYGGGGIKNLGNTTLVNCTVSGNTAGGAEGGGIYNLGNIIMTNCTVSGNSCTSEYSHFGGGGILNTTNDTGAEYNVSSATLYLTDCTIVSNTAGTGPGGGIQDDAGAVTYAEDTIIAENSSNDFSGVLNSEGYNLIRNTNGCALTGNLTGNIYGVDPLLGPLQNNGGLTMTHALLPGSPAINAGPADASPYFDQRGVTRPQGPADDIGAFEYGSVPSPALVALAPTGDGCFHINFAGVPGFNYTLQRASSPAGPWTALNTATAAFNGTVGCVDTNPPKGKAFYRAACQSH